MLTCRPERCGRDEADGEREGPGRGGRVHEEFEAARLKVREALRSLERLVSDELASL